MVYFFIIFDVEMNILKNKYIVFLLILMGFIVYGFNNINRFEDV